MKKKKDKTEEFDNELIHFIWIVFVSMITAIITVLIYR